MTALELWTIGHSTHGADGFVALLQAHGIEAVADVRRFPGSRRHPQFGSEALAATLDAHGIAYRWIQELGGRRRPLRPPGHSAWRNRSFEAYSEHVETEEFARGLEVLLHMGAACRTAIMCSELLWWRCHRALIADVLLFSGAGVTHILGPADSRRHAYTSPARIRDGELRYCACE
jgi:uncharacterized protein (DUF488 family)